MRIFIATYGDSFVTRNGMMTAVVTFNASYVEDIKEALTYLNKFSPMPSVRMMLSMSNREDPLVHEYSITHYETQKGYVKTLLADLSL